MTQTTPPAPYLGQYIHADTDLTLESAGHKVYQLAADGSRLVIKAFNIFGGYDWPQQRSRILAAGDPAVFWGPIVNRPSVVYGEYLPYPPDDGIAIGSVPDAVNQRPDLVVWLKHAARFAHYLNLWHGTRTAGGAERANVETIFQLLELYLGHLWVKLDEYAAIEPTEFNVLAHQLEWQRRRPEFESVVNEACLQCNIPTYPEVLYENADIPAHQRSIDTGILAMPERSDEPPWQPLRIIDLARNYELTPEEIKAEQERFYGQRDRYHDAKRYYSTHVDTW